MSRYLENWYLEAGLDLEASDFLLGDFLEPKESGFRDQSGFRGRGCRHGGCSLNPDPTVLTTTYFNVIGTLTALTRHALVRPHI